MDEKKFLNTVRRRSAVRRSRKWKVIENLEKALFRLETEEEGDFHKINNIKNKLSKLYAV